MKRTEPTLRLTDPRRPYNPSATVAETWERAKQCMPGRRVVSINGARPADDKAVSTQRLDMPFIADDRELYSKPVSPAEVICPLAAIVCALLAGAVALRALGVA